MSAIEDIAAERQRQIDKEGWSFEHDDEHTDGSLAAAAACYANPFEIGIQANRLVKVSLGEYRRPFGWPWPQGAWWKPNDRRRNLVRAGALIVAEIERLDRAGKP